MDLFYPLLRAGRYLSWRFPRLYMPLGRMRGRIFISNWEFDLWVGGFPRSANSYTWKAFEYMLPRQRVVGHLHIPALIIRALQTEKPGVLLIRRPADAALSWSICTNLSLRHCLDYYIDFHRILQPYRKCLITARFEDATADAASVLDRINRRFGVPFDPLPLDALAKEEIFGRVDELFKYGAEKPSELQVGRPSEERRDRKKRLQQELKGSDYLQAKLAKADALYLQYLPVFV